MAKWILIGVALLVLWYILAPLITPRPLRPRKRRDGKQGDEVIDSEGRIID